MEPLIMIEKVYTETEGHLSEVMKHEKRHYKVGKDKDFFIKLKLVSENYLGEHTLRCDMLMDQIDKGYPIVENTARLMEYSYMEGKPGYAVMKVTIHSITRSHQSIPFRIVISSIPKNQQSINFSVMSDPIIVVSKMPSKKKIESTNNNTTSNNTNKNNNTNNINGNINNFSNNVSHHLNQGENHNPNLEEISRNIQQMMEMLQNQSNMLQKVSTAVENQNLELYYHQLDQPTKKKQRSEMTDEEIHNDINDPFYLGQEPLQASIYNLINEYKELPTKDKKQKRLRQLLYDLQGKDQNMIREFAEDVLEIFNNPVTLQPNPPVNHSHPPNTNFNSFLNTNTSNLNNNTSHLMNNNTSLQMNNNTSHLMNNNLVVASPLVVGSPVGQFNNSSTSFLDDILLNPGDNMDSDMFQNNTFPF